MGYNDSNDTTDLVEFGFYYSTTVTVVALCITAVLMISIIIGNGLILLAFYLEKALRQPSNYLLVHLAVSDLFVGSFSLAIEVYYVLTRYWLLGDTFCKIWRMISWTAFSISEHGIFVISIDRFFTIRIPGRYRAWRTENKLFGIIFLLWGVPVATNFLNLALWAHVNFEPIESRPRCSIIMEAGPFIFLSIVYFWLPLFFMSLIYWYIYRVAFETNKKTVERATKKPDQTWLSSISFKKSIKDVVKLPERSNEDASQSGWKRESRVEVETRDKKRTSLSYESSVSALRNNSKDVGKVPKGFNENANHSSCNRECGVEHGKTRSWTDLVEQDENYRSGVLPGGEEASLRFNSRPFGAVEHGDVPEERMGTNHWGHIKCLGDKSNTYKDRWRLYVDDTFPKYDDINTAPTIEQDEGGYSVVLSVHNFQDYKHEELETAKFKRSQRSNFVSAVDNINNNVPSSNANSGQSSNSDVHKPRPVLRVKSKPTPLKGEQDPKIMQLNAEAEQRVRKAFRLISLILVSFALSYGPFSVVSIMSSLMKIQLSTSIIHVCSTMSYLSSAINPWVYAFVNPLFRQTFLRLFRGDCHKNRSVTVQISFIAGSGD